MDSSEEKIATELARELYNSLKNFKKTEQSMNWLRRFDSNLEEFSKKITEDPPIVPTIQGRTVAKLANEIKKEKDTAILNRLPNPIKDFIDDIIEFCDFLVEIDVFIDGGYERLSDKGKIAFKNKHQLKELPPPGTALYELLKEEGELDNFSKQYIDEAVHKILGLRGDISGIIAYLDS